MNLKQRIDADLKSAMLAGDRLKVDTLRGLKGAILNEEVAQKQREVGLSDDAVLKLLAKEAKKRVESAGYFEQGSNLDAAKKEMAEKDIIDSYLPAQISEDDLKSLVEKTITELNADGNPQMMGQVIAKVRTEAGPTADGGAIAKLVKELLNK